MVSQDRHEFPLSCKHILQFKDRFEEYDRKIDDVQSSLDEIKKYDEKLDDLQASIDELKK